MQRAFFSVCGKELNLALGKPAFQSTTHTNHMGSAGAEYAVGESYSGQSMYSE